MQDLDLILSDLSPVDGIPMTTSRLVAKRFGKSPSSVNRAIRALVETEEGPCNFAPTPYTDSQGKTQTEYRISKDGFCLLAMGFTGPEALRWKRAYINAFNAMTDEIAEASRVPAIPLSLHEQALKLHAEAKTSEAMASIHGRGLRKRRTDKPVLEKQIALMERALQLCIALDLPGLPDVD